MGWGLGRPDGCWHQLRDPLVWDLMLTYTWRQVLTSVYTETLFGPGPLSTHIFPMFSPSPARTGYQLFSKAKGHHQPDAKPAVPRDSQVSVAAMPESWLCASEAKVSKSLTGWWE